MSDTQRSAAADKLDREGEDPAAESGAGYGSHAPEVGEEDADSGDSDEKGA